MSRRSRTGEVDPIPTPDEGRAPAARSGISFDIDDIHAAIGDLTADVQSGHIDAVELPSSAPSGSMSPVLQGLAQVEAGFGPTDEQLPVPEFEPVSAYGVTGDHGDSAPAPPYPAPPYADPSAPPFAEPFAPPSTPYAEASAPPFAHSAAPPPGTEPSAPPSYAPPPAAPPYAEVPAPPFASAPPADPFASPPPPGRKIQNVETAYVRNPLLSPRPPAPSAAPAPPGAPPVAAEAFGPTTGQPSIDAPPRGRLVVQGGDWNGTQWFLNRAETRLGRGEENDIVVLDIGVSRNHLVLARHAEGFRLVDLGSGNGTYVNGRRIAEVELYDGDRIDLGHTSLIFGTMGQPRVRPPGTAEHATGRRLPTSWLVVMALTTFCTVLGTMYLVRSLKGGDGPPAAVVALQEAVAGQDWAAAKRALEEARGAGVDEAELGDLPARIEQESAALAAVEKARTMVMGAVPPADALKLPETLEALLASVPPGSAYYPDTRSLIQQARQLRVGALLDEAEKLMDEGKSVRARLQLRTALDEDPANARAKTLRRKLDQLENR